MRASSIVAKKAPSKKAKSAEPVTPPAAAAKASNGNGASAARTVSKSATKSRTAAKATPPLKAPAASKPAAAKAPATKAAPPSSAKPSALKAKSSSKAAPAPAALAPAKKPARKSIKEAAGVSTDAVARRTGKSWDDWFEVLDSAGAATLDQRGIVAILAQKHGIGPWWQQMIAVGYESLRAKSDKPVVNDGFQISHSCILDAPLPRVFRLWNDAGERARWLADDRFVVRGATADKVIRARWGKGNSHVAVSFNEKSGRTEVSVEHQQIESRGAADQMKAYWAKKLSLIGELLTPRR